MQLSRARFAERGLALGGWAAVGLGLWFWSANGGKFNLGSFLLPVYLLAVVVRALGAVAYLLHRI